MSSRKFITIYKIVRMKPQNILVYKRFYHNFRVNNCHDMDKLSIKSVRKVQCQYENSHCKLMNIRYMNKLGNSYYHGTNIYKNVKNDQMYNKKIKINSENYNELANKNLDEIIINELSSIYSEPLKIINNYYDIMAMTNGSSINLLDKSFEQSEQSWSCTYTMKWPENKTFASTASSKRRASILNAYKCLLWLKSLDLINEYGMPKPYKRENTVDTFSIDMDDDILNKMMDIVEYYDKDISHLIHKELQKKEDVHDNVEYKGIINEITVDPISRNNYMYRKFLNKLKTNEDNYPILKLRDEIIQKLDNNQVIIIQGQTGCGKSTQVPQIIMDYYSNKKQSSFCNIVVTQPRKISTISIAEKVAAERGESIGDVVGYQVRFDCKLPDYPGSILYCTIGILCKKLNTFSDLDGISHIIIDEVHERSVELDILLTQLKYAMKINKDVKIILMSATVNTDLFQKYFGNCPLINVPGSLHPVEMHFLEDMIDKNIINYDSLNTAKYNEISTTPELSCSNMAQLIKYIVENKPPGAILCFLPGWISILTLKKTIEQVIDSYPIKIILLHSKISSEEQKLVFKETPENVRKIILSTNIAETGITVPDVVYVVDSTLHNTMILNYKKCSSSVFTNLVSKSNIKQRRGRAGRTKPGESYHFIFKRLYNNLDEFCKSAIHNTTLDHVVLHCKAYSDGKIETFFKEMPEPPCIYSVRSAVANLIKIGALDSEENITYLGNLLLKIGESPHIGKALILSNIFRCFSPILNVSAYLSSKIDIFTNPLLDRQLISSIKKKYNERSDYLAISHIFRECINVLHSSKEEKEEFFKTNKHLSYQGIQYLQKFRRDLIKHLHELKIIDDFKDYNDLNNSLNEYSSVDDIMCGVLYNSTDNLLYYKKYVNKNGYIKQNLGRLLLTGTGEKAFLTADTVNNKRPTWPSPYLTFIGQSYENPWRGLLIRDSSLISPLCVVLFSPGKLKCSEINAKVNVRDEICLQLIDKRLIKINCNNKSFEPLIKFREALWGTVEYFYKMYDVKLDPENSDCVKIMEFKDKMLQVLAEALERDFV